MPLEGDSFDAVRANFSWQIPELFNIGVDVCDQWAKKTPHATAILEIDEEGAARAHTFAQLEAFSNRMANLLRALGMGRGHRIGVLMPQRLETAAAHIAVYKLGGIAVPLFSLFGPEALQFRLADAGVKAVITDRAGAQKLHLMRAQLPALEYVFCVDGDADGAYDLHALMAGQAEQFTPTETRADDPAVIIYTSGTTGNPKGALHAHRVLLGHLPGVEISHDFFPQAGDRIWTPADWAWIGGLLDVLLPALHHGVTVVAKRFAKFDPEAAFALMAKHKVRNAFLPPTALKLMRKVPQPQKQFDLQLRSVASGGESLGLELLDWGREVFGVTINEFYGQTECNMIVAASDVLERAPEGAMGRAAPGHDVQIVDDAGTVCAIGEVGNIAVKAPDPVMFLGYWRNEAATLEKLRGDWLLTGDTGSMDAKGWIYFLGRADDVITSSGYRIGPGEVEDCLIAHPAVQLAGVVGKPDAERTEIVKAYIVLNAGFAGTKQLARDISDWVKTRLAAHEYPREIDFVSELPMTTTGKIIRRELRVRAAAEADDKKG